MLNTIFGTLREGDKVVVKGTVRETWTRTVIEITPQYVKVVGGVKFDTDTLRSRECFAHKIIDIIPAK